MSASGPQGRVFDIQRFCVYDGPGIRTTVFLAGCSLRCQWCQNPEAFAGSSAELRTAQAVIEEVLRDRDYYASSGGGLTVSGGEPLLQPVFLRALLELAKEAGIHRCVQTAGAVSSSALMEVIDLVDLFQFDLKHMDSARHRALTGAPNDRILDNAARLVAQGARVEFRMPLVPGINDDAPHLERVAERLSMLGVTALRLVPYQRGYLGKYEQLGLTAPLAEVHPPSVQKQLDVARWLGRRGITVGLDG